MRRRGPWRRRASSPASCPRMHIRSFGHHRRRHVVVVVVHHRIIVIVIVILITKQCTTLTQQNNTQQVLAFVKRHCRPGTRVVFYAFHPGSSGGGGKRAAEDEAGGGARVAAEPVVAQKRVATIPHMTNTGQSYLYLFIV
mmetsp:Transcript_25767/g.48100  ORF Transcript_25767/g.48100 Transcript_25767/m.48100 type:complete len:140 (-) Transcript_25767:55-474(-)